MSIIRLIDQDETLSHWNIAFILVKKLLYSDDRSQHLIEQTTMRLRRLEECGYAFKH